MKRNLLYGIFGFILLCLLAVGYNSCTTATASEDQTVTTSQVQLFTEIDTILTGATETFTWEDDMIKRPATANLALDFTVSDSITVYVEHGFWYGISGTPRWVKGEILYTARPHASPIDTVFAIPLRGRGIRLNVAAANGAVSVTTGQVSLLVRPNNE